MFDEEKIKGIIRELFSLVSKYTDERIKIIKIENSYQFLKRCSWYKKEKSFRNDDSSMIGFIEGFISRGKDVIVVADADNFSYDIYVY